MRPSEILHSYDGDKNYESGLEKTSLEYTLM
jgi:hypothetical protein